MRRRSVECMIWFAWMWFDVLWDGMGFEFWRSRIIAGVGCAVVCAGGRCVDWGGEGR